MGFKKLPGSIGVGIFILIFSLGMFGFVLWFILPNLYYLDGVYSITPYMGLVLYGIVTVLMAIMGVMMLRRGIINKKVMAKGRRGTCVVESFETRHTRYGMRIWMNVSYKGEDGKRHTYASPINQDVLNSTKQGTILECKILGNDCYVDINHLKVVDKEFDVDLDDDFKKFEDKSLDNW